MAQVRSSRLSIHLEYAGSAQRTSTAIISARGREEDLLASSEDAAPGAARVFELLGVVSRASASVFAEELEAADLTDGSRVLIDARGLTSCQRECRGLLVEAQKALGRRGCRTAWLVDRPSTHGLAMWVVNLAGDPGARTVATEALAGEWLSVATPRLEQNQDRFEDALEGLRRWGGR